MATESAASRAHLVEEMTAAAESFYHFGWLFGAGGNLSCRLGEKSVVVTATRKPKQSLSVEDFVDVDFEGKSDTKGPEPSTDTPVHVAIYKKLDHVNAIYHVHHLDAALCSDRDQRQGFTHFRELEMLRAFELEEGNPTLNVPIVENAAEQKTLIDNILSALDENEGVPCVNVCNHGLYVFGRTPEEARRHVEALGYLFSYSLKRPMNPKKSASVSGFQL